VNNHVHHFGAIGLTNGLAILADRETRTHWDHITGEAIAGPLTGSRLEVWSFRMTTVAAALAENPDITVSASTYHSFQRNLAQRLYPHFIHGKVWLPNFIYASMNSPVDPRMDRLTQGLGVIIGNKAKYYPMSRIPADGICDPWLGRVLRVQRGELDGVPRAKWQDTNEEPLQLLSRWYGFSFTYPSCEIFEQ
jgi:hypothetical protein